MNNNKQLNKMSKHNITTAGLIALLMIVSFAGCQSGKPGFDEGKLWVENHFNKENYNGLIEVLHIELIDIVEDTYNEGQYVNVKMGAQIDVKEDYLVSRMFIYDSFEVSEDWPESFKAQTASAATEEEKAIIKETFDTYTFSKGQHPITIYVEYAFIDQRWVITSANMIALDFEEEPSEFPVQAPI